MYKNKKVKKGKVNNKKSAILGLLMLALLVGGAIAYILQKPDTDTALDQQQQMAAEVDSERAKQEADEARGSASDPLKDQDESEPEVVTDNVQLGQPTFEQSGGIVSSSVSVVGASSGKCSFVFSTPEDRPVSRDVNISSGSCSVSIPEAEFAKLGEWTLSVSLSGKSATRMVNID